MELSEPPSHDIINRPVAEIESSQSPNEEKIRQQRGFNKIMVTSTTTLTFTSYSINTTVFTTSVTLGSTTAVNCIPSGITIC